MTIKDKNDWLKVLMNDLLDYGIYYTKHNRFYKWSKKPDFHASNGLFTSKSKDAFIAWAEGFLMASSWE